MIIDKNLVMSDAQEVLTTTESKDNADPAVEQHIDTLAAGDAISPGARLHVLVDTKFVGEGATLTIALETGTTSDCGTAIFTTAALAVGTLTAGAVLVDIVIPKGVLQYLRMYYTVGSGPFTAGNIDARIVLDTAKTMDKNL